MKKSLLILLAVSTFLVGEAVFLHFKTPAEPATETTAPEPQTERQPAPETEKPEQAGQKSVAEKKIVPFTTQAPVGKWDNPIFQDGCEEASVLMAMGWVRDTKAIAATDAADGIVRLADFEKKKFGYHEDIDLSEIISVFREYFGYDAVTIEKNISLADLKKELADGNIILVPTYGKALGNPNFTAPGPVTHMLVMTGYDPKAEAFIVNDPGTRRGENYRYAERILFDAIWAYPPGKVHPPEPAKAEREKSVIVVHDDART